MKKAINAWSMDGALTFEQSFAAAKKAGFDGIELNVDAPGSPHSLTMDTTEHELGEIASLSEKYALPVVSISTSLYGGKLGGAADEENEFAKTLMLHQIRCAKALGAGAVLTVPGADLSRVSMKQCRARAIALLSDAAEEVEASGITVGLENVWERLLYVALRYARLYRGDRQPPHPRLFRCGKRRRLLLFGALD